MQMEELKRILIISSDKNLREVLSFCFDGWGYEVFLAEVLSGEIQAIKKISPHVIIMDIHSLRKTYLEVCHALKEDFTTNFIPIVTLINKRQLRSQLLNLKYGVDDYLIKPPDPLDLRVRVEMAIKRSQYSFYATPLTGLPAGRIIEDALKERLKKETPFSFVYMDIDNFKYFNDVYGYVRGDRVIMQTAYLLYSAIKKLGNKEDFLGHIGGDDFVFITTPDKYKEICEDFILAFDRLIPFHYTAQDRKQGFIVAADRTHKIKNIPLMSVSLAVVNRLLPEEIKNPIEINERVVEIKKYLKVIAQSKFMAERRGIKLDSDLSPHIYKRDTAFLKSYQPLGQILCSRSKISPEQLDEALIIHWKRGIILGEVLKELGFVNEKVLAEALRLQKERFSVGKREYSLFSEKQKILDKNNIL